jgi:hypothetical protein
MLVDNIAVEERREGSRIERTSWQPPLQQRAKYIQCKTPAKTWINIVKLNIDW